MIGHISQVVSYHAGLRDPEIVTHSFTNICRSSMHTCVLDLYIFDHGSN